MIRRTANNSVAITAAVAVFLASTALSSKNSASRP